MKKRDPFIGTFREIQPKFSRLMARSLADAKLTLPQYALLNLVASAGQLPMTEASEKLHITKPAVTSLVDRLEKNQFLKRLPHPTDRRVWLLAIEPKGFRITRRIQSLILNLLLATFRQFSAHEKEIVTRFYRKLGENLDEMLMKKRKKK